MAGLLALVGGAEFTPGNEQQDELMVRRSPPRPSYVVSTAAARQGREPAVATAHRWFGALGRDLEELPILTRRDAADADLVGRAAGAGLLYLLGGEPGPVADVLRGSEAWTAMVAAWRGGAVLAGSSAGAMGLCEWVLLRDRWPDRTRRRYSPACGLIRRSAVVPHFDTFGHRWLPSAVEAMPEPEITLIGIDERTAAIWDGDRWQVTGPGSVTIIAGGGRETQVFRSGERVLGIEPPGLDGVSP